MDDKLLPVNALPTAMSASQSAASLSSTRKDVADDESIHRSNLKRALAAPSISSQSLGIAPELTSTPGYRAAEAYVRPAPIATVRTLLNYTFNLQKCEFTLGLQATDAREEAPTVVSLPEYHFPADKCIVEVTSGKWEISSDEDDGVLLQKLKWWHGGGEQSLKVTGVAQKHTLAEGVAEDGGYYDQFNHWAGLNCTLM